jgi:DNA-binding GntR family transcriptional regulator
LTEPRTPAPAGRAASDRRNLPIRRETLGAQVYHLLRDRILRGEFPGGTRLTQGPLSEEIGTSRIPIRDALKRLESDGLVACDDTGRYTVVQFGAQDANEVYAIRRRLEPFAVEKAVEAMTAEAMSDIESLFLELSKAARLRQLDRYIETNINFHMAIYEASGMGRLVRIIRSLYIGVPPLTPIVLEGRIARSQQEHKEIMERLAARDAAGAARAMDRHIENAGAELRNSLDGAGDARPPAATERRRKRNDGQVLT